MYKLTNFNSVTRLSDGAAIPFDPANRDYQEFLAWKDAGNEPLPADAPSKEEQNAPVLTGIEALENKTLRAIREYILGDTTAKDRLKVVDNEIAALRAALKK